MRAFTKEWLEQLAVLLKKDEIYQKKAKGFDSTYQFLVKADPEKGVPNDLACGLVLPQCSEIWNGLREDSNYVMIAPYGVFHKIIKGELKAVMAITMRKAKIKGNLAKLLKYNGATNRFNELLQEVAVEFDGDYQ